MEAPGQALLDPRAPVTAGDLPRPPLLPALTSLRFFAALSVALYHFLPQDNFLPIQRPGGILSGLFGSGYVGVSFFFVLSGFILTYAHGREFGEQRGSVARFYYARFARIYPVYLFSLLVSAAVFFGTFQNPRHVAVLVVDALMLQAWSAHTILFLNIPSWTLSCEAFFYVLFPLLLLRLRASSWRRTILWGAVLWLVALAIPAAALGAQLGWHWALWLPEQPGALGFVMNPLATLPLFLAGIVLGWAHLRSPLDGRAGLWATGAGGAVVLVAMLLAQHLPDTLLRNGLLLPGFAAVLLGAATENPLTRLLSARPLLLLGEASYAFYLLHYPLNRLWVDRLHGGEGGLAAVEKLALLIPISIAVYVGLERPARWWLLLRRARRTAGVSAAPSITQTGE